MSLFRQVEITCPACEHPSAADTVDSVNADRRPDLKAAIVAGDFQVRTCPSCGARFRVAPMLTYLDVAQRLWIAVRPAEEYEGWSDLEKISRDAFDNSYGPGVGQAAQAVGANLRPRLVFGWSGLKEKIVGDAAGLDDIDLELVKLTLIRGLDASLAGDETELRLSGATDTDLTFDVIDTVSEVVSEQLTVPRGLYDDVHRDKTGFDAVRRELGAGFYVDVSRLLVEA